MVEPNSTSTISPEEVLKYNKPTEKFLCKLADNVYNIQFLSFRIRDMETNTVLFEVKRENAGSLNLPPGVVIDEDAARTVRYNFGTDFFKYRTIGTSLEFSVGDKPVKKFRMIERHYFRDRLLRSYDFEFPFCMPNSVNTWESIYDVPQMDENEMIDMITHPGETKSDSFYFVNGELVMHNKAEYSYIDMDDENVD
eukprot:TRINITY_DN216_c0_g1_i1.p1 TRINITY_DN216_c0_g1~~TRINITY_DN216_c0_g1_i1.p1  ORF type:complete len:196 (-),score=30.70 TRINITY_DN216_c0_g1_i1:136-723(-)